MKKIITLFASAATLCAFSVAKGELTYTGFETAAYVAGQALSTTNDDMNRVVGQPGFAATWVDISATDDGDNKVMEYGAAGAKDAPTGYDVGNNYLHVETGANILERYAVYGGGVTNISSGLYLDTLVMFTASSEVFKDGEIADGDKIAIQYVAQDLEDVEPGQTPLSNIVVRAAYIDGSTIVPTNYVMNLPEGFSVTNWHRLTVRAIANVGSATAPVGFAIYLDGSPDPLTYDSDVVPGDEAYTNSLNGIVKTFLYKDGLHALLPSLVKSGDYKTTLTSVGFKGTGEIDNVGFTQDPGFIDEGMTVTIAWDENVASYTVVAGDKTLVDGETVSGEGSRDLTIDPGIATITVTATYKDNYEAGEWTVTGSGASISGDTFTIVAGAKLNIVSIYPYFQVGEAFYEDFDAALSAATTGSGVIKLNADYPYDIALTEGTVTIDLAGKTITGDTLAAIMNGGADLIITNSTVEIGHIVNPAGADTFAVLIGGGTTSIYGGWVDGLIEFDTFELPQDLLFLYGGYYNDATTTDPAAFYRNDCARDVVSYVSDPAYYFQVGSDTPEPPAPTSVDVPSAMLGILYDGSLKTGVVEQVGFTLSGNTATEVGNYLATATLEDGYVWSDDNTTTNKTIPWSIGYNNKATVVLTLSSEIAEYTDLLEFPEVTAKVGIEDVTGTPEWDPAKISEPDAGTTNTYTVTFTVMNGGYTGSTGTAEFKVYKSAGGGEDWPADPTTVSGETAADAFGITGDLANADAGVLATWAKANSVNYADRTTTILTDAFLLNCANTQEAVDAAKANFKVTAITVVGDTVTITPEDAADYGNGKIVIEGAAALTSPMSWHAKTTGDHFFRATLVVKPVAAP